MPTLTSPKPSPSALEPGDAPTPAPHRLHIGAMGPHSLAHPALEKLVDPSWIHLGDTPATENRSFFLRWKNEAIRRLRPFVYKSRGLTPPDYAAIRERTRFLPFYYQIGDRLDFADSQFRFIFSEHFFEHLYLDEAAALFREAHRILAPGGVMRIAVPDADLRTYERPEPIGYPHARENWNEPDKHKTRWSVYSLSQVLGDAGFAVRPLVYCDKFGDFRENLPTPDASIYRLSQAEPFVFDLSCIKRLRSSLVVDAIKPGPGILPNAAQVARRLHHLSD